MRMSAMEFMSICAFLKEFIFVFSSLYSVCEDTETIPFCVQEIPGRPPAAKPIPVKRSPAAIKEQERSKILFVVFFIFRVLLL